MGTYAENAGRASCVSLLEEKRDRKEIRPSAHIVFWREDDSRRLEPEEPLFFRSPPAPAKRERGGKTVYIDCLGALRVAFHLYFLLRTPKGTKRLYEKDAFSSKNDAFACFDYGYDDNLFLLLSALLVTILSPISLFNSAYHFWRELKS
jgi:hypothetical protein